MQSLQTSGWMLLCTATTRWENIASCLFLSLKGSGCALQLRSPRLWRCWGEGGRGKHSQPSQLSGKETLCTCIFKVQNVVREHVLHICRQMTWPWTISLWPSGAGLWHGVCFRWNNLATQRSWVTSGFQWHQELRLVLDKTGVTKKPKKFKTVWHESRGILKLSGRGNQASLKLSAGFSNSVCWTS